MIRNYLTIAFRILWNNKVFSLINILGLAIGMAAAMILIHYVQFEKSYDTFHENTDRIFRVNYGFESPRWTGILPTTHPGVAPTLHTEIPEIVDYTRFVNHSVLRNACIISYQPENQEEVRFDEDQQQVFYADVSIFSMFTFPLLKGNVNTALEKPNSIALSVSMAKKYFGDQDPVGKMLHVEDWSVQENKNYLVTAVFKDIPLNSHLQFDILISFSTINTGIGWSHLDANWGYPRFSNYIMLAVDFDIAAVSQIAGPLFDHYNRVENEKFRTTMGGGEGFNFSFQSLKKIHLSNITTSDFTQKDEVGKLYFLTIVAIMIIVIACINYINLSTAKATLRSREVGLRKVIGAGKKQLFIQFLFESIIINLFALVIAITIMQLVTQPFNELVGKEVITLEMINPGFIGLVVILFLGCIGISGLYPAFILTSFKIVEALKGKIRLSNGVSVRNGLVLVQFSASIILISGIFAIWSQLNYLDQQHLGFSKDQIMTLILPTQEDNIPRIETLQQKLFTNAHITNLTNSQFIPGIKNFGLMFLRFEEYENRSKSEAIGKGCRYFAIDDHYLETFDIQIIAGRNFSTIESMDHDAVLINERARKDLGYSSPEDAIESYIIEPSGKPKLKIIGVFEDYYHEAPKWEMFPMVLQNKGYASLFAGSEKRWGWPGKYLSVRFAQQPSSDIVRQIEATWKNILPGAPFNYFFLDDKYNIQYGDDRQLAKIVGLFSMIAVFITCLGLFGLTLFNTLKRTKEIGIRKALGAPVKNIVTLLTKDSLKLIAFASLIAVPASYWGVRQWLENFASRIAISPGLFIIPILILLFISAVTIAWQILKASRANPVKALRYE